MKIAVCNTKFSRRGIGLMEAVTRGLAVHGVKVPLIAGPGDIRKMFKCDAVVMVCDVHDDDVIPMGGGSKGSQLKIRQLVKRNCERYTIPRLIIETGFIQNSHQQRRRVYQDGPAYWAASWEGIKSQGNYCLPDTIDGSRFIWDYPPDRSPSGDTVAIFGQVQNGYAEGRTRWMVHYIEACRMVLESGMRCMFRPHPALKGKGLRRFEFKIRERAGDVRVTRDPWEMCSGEVRTALAWMSNAGVDVVMSGVPLICRSGLSVVSNIASHDLNADEFKNPRIIPYADRIDHLNRLSFMQWTIDEFRKGLAWEQLKRKLEQ